MQINQAIFYFRCIVDETVQFFSSHQPYVEFEIEAFKFIRFYDQVRVAFIPDTHTHIWGLSIDFYCFYTDQTIFSLP